MTKRCFLLVFFCALCHASLFATPGLPPAQMIDTDTLEAVLINDSSLQMLEDRIGDLEFDQVRQGAFEDNFHSLTTDNNGHGYSNHTYWLRCHLKNSMDRRASIFFYPGYADRIDYYFSSPGGNWKQETTGYLYPTDNKSIYQKNYYIPVTLEPGEDLVIYVRLYINYYYFNDYDRPRKLGLMYGSQEQLVSTYNELSLFPAVQEAVFFGVLIIAVIYNLLFFWTVRERLYLYFSLFLLCFAMYYCNSFLLTTNFCHQHPRLFFYTLNIWGPLYLFFEMFFIRHFFKAWRYTPRWNYIMIGVAIFQLASRMMAVYAGRVLPVTWGEFLWKMDLANSYIVNVSILVTFFIYVRKKTPYSNVLVFAALPFTLYLTIIRTSTIAFDLFNVGYQGTLFEIVFWLKKWNYIFYLISVFWLVIFFTLILFFRYKRLQKENTQQALDKERLALEKETERSELIAKQKIELEHQVKERTSELNQSLDELKSMQAQLVQSEKMASLGELTAGIAHEIQNPLNFVNNFSEVSHELLEEMKTELSNDNREEARAIADDVKLNLEKVIYHGKRAGAIVKGMLQHSRTNSGQKEPTALNALADEYLQLSWHGLRAKDKTFNAVLQTDFDPAIGKINIIPQDIGRVLLNLYNNAFYAVTEKKKAGTAGGFKNSESGAAYEPTVSVSTKKINGKPDNNQVEIRVKDNGNGIPQKIVDKIFQPFFTTKPSGQGTGLGLSLSYDIVKAHGGEIKVETRDGEGSTFIIQLPV